MPAAAPEILPHETPRPDWYRPGKSMTEFHASTARCRVLIGGRGSGKTTGVGVEAIRHCTHYAGAKVLVVRKTNISNADTSVRTFDEVYTKMGFRVGIDEDISLFRKWQGGLTARIPSIAATKAYNEFMATPRSREQIRAWIANEGDRLCSYIEFRGLKDEAKAEGQLRGYECSMGIMVEADLLEERDLDLFMGCLRWKDAYGNPIEDYCMILDTNPPDPDHWIAEMEKTHAGDPDYAFWHIKTQENEHNLPRGYIENLEKQYRRRPAHRKRYLLGQYAVLYEGQPVYYAFSEDKHASEDIPWPKGAYLICGWDFGAAHAVIFSAYFSLDFIVGKKKQTYEYWWDLFEIYEEMSDTERQCRSVQAVLERHFPFYNDREICAGVSHVCDPAGKNTVGLVSDLSGPISVLNANGFYPKWQTRMRGLDLTIGICNRLMEQKDPKGRYVYRIDKKYCPRLFRALAGQYRYPMKGEPGYMTGEPIHGPKAKGADDCADSFRYPKVYHLRMAQKIADELKKPVGVLGAKPKSLNRRRTDW